MSDVNPYAAPQAEADATNTRAAFAISPETRKLIAAAATLMVVAGVLELIPATINLMTHDLSVKSIGTAAFLGFMPAFVAYAGLTLRRLGTAGDDRTTMLEGFRQLHVAFLVKGVILLALVTISALTFLGVTALGIF